MERFVVSYNRFISIGFQCKLTPLTPHRKRFIFDIFHLLLVPLAHTNSGARHGASPTERNLKRNLFRNSVTSTCIKSIARKTENYFTGYPTRFSNLGLTKLHAPMLRGSSWHQTKAETKSQQQTGRVFDNKCSCLTLGVFVLGQLFLQFHGRKRAEALDSHNGRVLRVQFLPLLVQRVVVFTRSQQHPVYVARFRCIFTCKSNGWKHPLTQELERSH